MSECIQAGQAPQFPLPFSHAVRSGDHVYVSGQVGVDPATLVKDGDTIESQTVRAFRNIELILNAAGLTLDHVVKVNAILSKGEDSPGYNKAYAGIMKAPYPARTTVHAGIGDYLVEIDVIASATSVRGEAR